jgi:hypothetical protein
VPARFAFCVSGFSAPQFTHPRVSLKDGALPHSAPRQGISRLRKEKVMSKTCGDTARFHRLRKQKINRRAKNRILQAEIAARKAEKAAKPTA